MTDQQHPHKKHHSPKVFDIIHPGKARPSATSRPLITTDKPDQPDPMMIKADEANRPVPLSSVPPMESAEMPVTAKDTPQEQEPQSEEPASENVEMPQTDGEESSNVEAVEDSPKTSEAEAEAAPSDSPVPESKDSPEIPDTTNDQSPETPEKENDTWEPSSQGSQATDEPRLKPLKDADVIAQPHRGPVVAFYGSGGNTKTFLKWLLAIIIVLILVVIAVDLALDSGLVKLSQNIPQTHFFDAD